VDASVRFHEFSSESTSQENATSNKTHGENWIMLIRTAPLPLFHSQQRRHFVIQVPQAGFGLAGGLASVDTKSAG